MADYPPPSFRKGDPGRVQRGRRKGFDRLVTDLITAWASFDAGLTLLMGEAFEVPLRNLRILLANLDIKSRIVKLKDLADHSDHPELKKLMAQWEGQYGRAVFPRNTVCHMHYFGTIKGHPELMVFGPSKAERGPPDDARVTVLHREYFEYSTKWAVINNRLVTELMRALSESPLSSLEPDRPPSSPKHSRKKQRPPPPPSRA